MPLVSVIIAARNAANTLTATLQSVLAQTVDDLEVIVVDDGSTDATREIAGGTGDPRLSVHSIPARGVSAARNAGLARAQGRYVSFLDADDIWTADKLDAQRHALRMHASAAAAYSWTIVIDARGDYLFAKPPSRYAGNVHRDLLMDLFLGSGSNIMIDRERTRSDLHFDESLTIAEDWDFQLRLARDHDFVCVPAYQVLYRLVLGSRSARAQALERTMRDIATRELALEPAPNELGRRVDMMIHEYISLQCLLRASKQLDLRTAARHWGASLAGPRRLLDPRTYVILGALGALAIVPPTKRPTTIQRLLRLYGKMFGGAAPKARVTALRID